jgi:glutathione synthase/RimK-type ligase-like ATP-grasp enzyme
VVWISTFDFGPAMTLSYDPADGGALIGLHDGTKIASDEVSAVWYRRPGRVQINSSIRDPLDRSFAHSEWREGIDGLFSTAFSRIVSPPLMQRAAIKPRQLAVAGDIGLAVPDTLITSDAGEALAFVERHGGAVVHKAMTAPPHRFIDARTWDTSAREQIAELAICPTILQQRVSGPGDVRITVVGERVFAARIDTASGRAAVDSRLDLDAPCATHALPDQVRTAILQLMRQLGLLFGTIDMKLTDEGEHVFLEVNPQGQFLYIEILTGMPIASAVADFLAHE